MFPYIHLLVAIATKHLMNKGMSFFGLLTIITTLCVDHIEKLCLDPINTYRGRIGDSPLFKNSIKILQQVQKLLS